MICLLGLNGCAIVSDAQRTMKNAGELIDYYRSQSRAGLLSREEVEVNPFASIGVRKGKSPQFLMTLDRISGSRHYWISADGLTLVTDYGRIHQTVGLPDDLGGLGSESKNALRMPRDIDIDEQVFHRDIDLPESHGFGFPVSCTWEDGGHEEIEILGTKFVAAVQLEHCQSKPLKWKFTNKHWADVRTGFIWRSRQWVSPEFDSPITIDILRPSSSSSNWLTHLARLAELEKS